MAIKFTAGAGLKSDGVIKVTFPDGYVLPSDSLGVVSASGMDGTQSLSAHGQVLTITRGAGQEAGSTDVVPNTPITITVSGIEHPDPSDRGTFTIGTFESNGSTATDEAVDNVEAVEIKSGTCARSKKFPPHICFMSLCVEFLLCLIDNIFSSYLVSLCTLFPYFIILLISFVYFPAHSPATL